MGLEPWWTKWVAFFNEKLGGHIDVMNCNRVYAMTLEVSTGGVEGVIEVDL